MAYFVERRADRAADPLRRRIGGDQLRVGGFERDELAKLRVVLGVGQLRRVLLVIEPVGPIEDLVQLGVASDRGVGRQVLRGADEHRVDGQAVGGFGHSIHGITSAGADGGDWT